MIMDWPLTRGEVVTCWLTAEALAAWTLETESSECPLNWVLSSKLTCRSVCVSHDLRCCPWLVFMKPNKCLCILWPAPINIDETLGLLTWTFPQRLDYDPCMLTHDSAWRGMRGTVMLCFSTLTPQHCKTSYGNIIAQKHKEKCISHSVFKSESLLD